MIKVEAKSTSSCRVTPTFQQRVEESMNLAGLEGTFQLIVIDPKEVICEEISTIQGLPGGDSKTYLTVFDLCAKSVTRARYTRDHYHSTENAYCSETMLPTIVGLRGNEIPEPLRDKMEKISNCVETVMKKYGPAP